MAVAVLGVLVSTGVTEGRRVLVLEIASIVARGVSEAIAGGSVGAPLLSIFSAIIPTM
ncbi:MAG: hypothetical protein ACK2T3_12850 [Candidatus Promineifilaceae bacterium]